MSVVLGTSVAVHSNPIPNQTVSRPPALPTRRLVMRPVLARSLAILTLVTAPTLLAAQSRTESDEEWLDHCRHDRGDSDRVHACEVRNVPVRLSGQFIAIDGERNGGIRVFGWDGDSVRVTARVQ